MDPNLVARLSANGPTWLRYMLTLSEAAKTGQSWVVASGEDIGLWDTDAGPVLPLWPSEELAEASVGDEAGGGPTPVRLSEITSRLLPYLVEADASLSLFPNFTDDMLVEPAAVAEDLADFSGESIDIAEEITAPVAIAEYDEWALLESPGVEDDEDDGAGATPTGEAPAATDDRYADALAAAGATGVLWLLDDPAEDAVVGIVLDDRPALAVFPTKDAAEHFAEQVDGDVVARAIAVGALVRGWLLVAYGGGWSVAIAPDAETAAFVEPTRFALEATEALAK